MDYLHYSDLTILYEDNHLLAVVKPPGILSQADSSGQADMLTLLKQYLKDKYQKPGEAWLGLVHRLDQPVGGVMVFAKRSKTASRLAEQIRQRSIGKHYYALVSASYVPDQLTAEDYLYQLKVKGKKITRVATGTDVVAFKAKQARLSFSRLASADVQDQRMHLLDIELVTGRSHQIRVQLASRGWPLVGDGLYGDRLQARVAFAGNAGKEHSDLALFCYQLDLDHPISGQRLVLQADMPQGGPWAAFSGWQP